MTTVMQMPRSMQEILDHADELAAKFEQADPDPADGKDATELRELRAAVLIRAEADRTLNEAVTRARGAGHSWASIGAMLGTSGEAARQRFGAPASTARARLR